MTKRVGYCERIDFGIRKLHYLVLRVHLRAIGDKGEEGPPVPIPNTEVKLLSVEDT